MNNILKNEWVNNEIREQTNQGKTYVETNENEQTTTQNLWDTVISFLRGKLIALQAYIKT